MFDELQWLERLEADGLVRRTLTGTHLTKRWHGALARASIALYRSGNTLMDIRVPVTRALMDAYPDESDESLVVAVRVVLPIVTADLERVAQPSSSP